VERCIFDEHLDVEVNGHDGHELVEWVNWGGAEGAGDVSDSFILGCMEFAKKGSLACVPYWCCIGKDQEDDCIVNCAPLSPVQAADGIAK
jgi:hypothetical protein